MYNEGETDEVRQLELNSVEEAHCTALVQSVRYLQGIRRYHDHNVRERSFSIGDLVLCRIQDESGLHKLNSRWEGLFVIKQVSVFNRLTTEGYTQGGMFWVRRCRDQELEGARNTKLRQVWAAKRVTPYVLYGSSYCLLYRMI
jgi:hypothetical protein